ncbi:hypothetical protein D3C84_884220 [compost metagenome]|jgi:hypothetical protein|nr:DUF2513 domain-containing protein [Pseudomonas sp. ODNR1LW]OMQ29164.1 hypothetical protein BKX96_30690 [Pseudomonas putida]
MGHQAILGGIDGERPELADIRRLEMDSVFLAVGAFEWLAIRTGFLYQFDKNRIDPKQSISVGCNVKRDNTLIFGVLSCIESSLISVGSSYSEITHQLEHDYGVSDDSEHLGDFQRSLEYQMEILEDAGFVKKYSEHYDTPENIFYRLTWAGHDYLDDRRTAGCLVTRLVT